ncbi:MAG: dehydrogenase [candidate division Zixibacteria bacterium]|nr:dehydrogenase [candidate division Zixibacteria bacterium]
MQKSFRVALVADLKGTDGGLVFKDFGVEILEAAGVPWYFFAEDRRPVTPNQLADCDVVVSMGQPYTPASFLGVERLALIARTGVGYDMVDLHAATQADVMVTITPEATTRSVASATLALMLGLCHRVRIKDAIVREHRWPDRFHHMGCELRDRVIGLVGFGLIGKEVARLLHVFGPAKTLASDPVVKPEDAATAGVTLTDLDTLLRESEFVSIHCPLTPGTLGLIGDRELRLMKPSAFLVNTARGPIVDQRALTAVLQEGRIAGAAIDVFEQEPTAVDDPLHDLENVILAPHASAWTYELFRDIGHDCMKAALAVSRGEIPKYVVNEAVLERPGLQAKLARLREAGNGQSTTP